MFSKNSFPFIDNNCSLFSYYIFLQKAKDEITSTSVTSTLYGRVVNEFGISIAGASVITGNYATNTDENGIFFFSNIKTDVKATTVKVTKAGYFNGSRTIFVKENQKQEVKIILLTKTLFSPNSTQSFDANTGGTLNFSEGVQLVFPSNGIKNKSTNIIYSGTVTVHARWIDPTTDVGQKTMPGTLVGLPADGTEEKFLQSFAMVVVELYDASGNELQIADGKEVEMTVNIPASLTISASSTIPLWYFDESKGKWVEEGSAILVGNKYVGKVKHFSFWNYDIPISAIDFEVTFVDQNGNPLSGSFVTLKQTPNISWGITNSNGWVGGKVPASASLMMEVYNPNCSGNILYTQTFSTGSSNLNLGAVTVALPASTIVTGTVVDCNSLPLGNSLVYIDRSPYDAILVAPSFIGAFSYSTVCPIISPLNIIAYDLGANVNGLNRRVVNSGTSNNLGTISACGNLNPFINISIKNNNTSATKSLSYSAPSSTIDCIKYSVTDHNIVLDNYYFGLYFADTTIGTHQVKDAFVYPAMMSYVNPQPDSTGLTPSSNSTITLNKYSPFPGNVEGSFIIQLTGYIDTNHVGLPWVPSIPSGNTYTVTGSFRAKREN